MDGNWVGLVNEWFQQRGIAAPAYEDWRQAPGTVACYFDKGHLVPLEALASHQAHCALKHDPTRTLAVCPLNPRHVLPQAEMENHLSELHHESECVKPHQVYSVVSSPGEWHCRIKFDGRAFEGAGQTKMAAKQGAARGLHEYLRQRDAARIGMPDPIDLLPPYQLPPELRVLCTDNPHHCDNWIRDNIAQNTTVIGFDTESCLNGSIALIQLATETRCLVYSLRRGGCPAELFNLLKSTRIFKVGVDITNDVKGLRALGVHVFATAEVGELASEVHGVAVHAGTRRLCAAVLKQQIDKDKAIATSDWTRWPLSNVQIRYAVQDAVVARQMYVALRRQRLTGC